MNDHEQPSALELFAMEFLPLAGIGHLSLSERGERCLRYSGNNGLDELVLVTSMDPTQKEIVDDVVEGMLGQAGISDASEGGDMCIPISGVLRLAGLKKGSYAVTYYVALGQADTAILDRVNDETLIGMISKLRCSDQKLHGLLHTLYSEAEKRRHSFLIGNITEDHGIGVLTMSVDTPDKLRRFADYVKFVRERFTAYNGEKSTG